PDLYRASDSSNVSSPASKARTISSNSAKACSNDLGLPASGMDGFIQDPTARPSSLTLGRSGFGRFDPTANPTLVQGRDNAIAGLHLFGGADDHGRSILVGQAIAPRQDIQGTERTEPPGRRV